MAAKLVAAHKRMNTQQQWLWDAIQIKPQRWVQEPWGVLGGGFWAVGIMGQTVIWYNDIENGFECSRYIRYGTIPDYCCNQYELEHILQRLVSGNASGD